MRERLGALGLALILVSATGCLGVGSVDYDVSNQESQQTQNGNTRTTYTAAVEADFDGYEGEDEHQVSVPEQGATLHVEPSLEAGSVEVKVAGPDGTQRFAETLNAGSHATENVVSEAEGTWTIVFHADDADGSLVVELS